MLTYQGWLMTMGLPKLNGGKADAPLYPLIELMFFAYRDFVADADRVLAEDGLGRAHHRVVYFVARRPGLTIAELLDILQITKQSLNRVLKDLLGRGFVVSRCGETDRRQRRLFATERGEALVVSIARVQSARVRRVLDGLHEETGAAAIAFLDAMIDRPERDGLTATLDASGGVGRRSAAREEVRRRAAH